MKPIKEMMERIAAAKAEQVTQMDNRSVVTTRDTRWEFAKAELKKIPHEFSAALAHISRMVGITKKDITKSNGTITRYSKMIDGYEFIFEIQQHTEKGLIRALITLYDNTHFVVGMRDLLKNEINRI